MKKEKKIELKGALKVLGIIVLLGMVCVGSVMGYATISHNDFTWSAGGVVFNSTGLYINSTNVVDINSGQTATFIVAASNSLHKERADYVCVGADDQKQIQAAIDALANGGGNVVLMEGAYSFSDMVKLPSNFMLDIRGTIRIVDNFTPTSHFSLNGRTVYTVFTNADHTNGNSDIHIKGSGRITAEDTTQDDTVSWAGIWLHNCSNSKIEELAIDHILYDITQEGGSNGTERFFAILLTKCFSCIIEKLNAGYTGDDTIGLRHECEGCIVKGCHVQHPKYGHTIQFCTASIFGGDSANCKRNSAINNLLHHTEGGGDCGGVASHSCNDLIIRGNVIYLTNPGVYVLGDSSKIAISDNFISNLNGYAEGIRIYSYASTKNITDINIDGNILVGNPNCSTRGIKLRADAKSIEHVNINNNVIRGFEYTGDKGIELESENEAIRHINVNNNMIRNMGHTAVNLFVKDTTGVEISDIIINALNAHECGCGVYMRKNQKVANITISNCNIKSTRENWAGLGEGSYGLHINDVSGIKCYNNEIDTHDACIKEVGNADNNVYKNNDVSGCGTPFAIVGTNNIISGNIGYTTENSGTSTGTGAQQTIAHGLAATPTKVVLWNIEDGANPYQSASADATNIYITAVINQDYGWGAEVV